MNRREIGEGLAYLLSWPAQLVCAQGMPASAGGQDTGMICWKVRGEGLCDPLGMGSERKGRWPQVFCYRAGDQSEAFHYLHR